MQIYLPIAELSVNVFLLLGLGGLTGILSGMFGVGGGFLLTPLLIFIGVTPAVAVSSSANQIIASSVSGLLAHLRRQNVDIKMGNYLLVGGLAGSSLGVTLFRWLQQQGQIDLIISLAYVIFLTLIGGVMALEVIRSHLNKGKTKPPEPVHERQPVRIFPVNFARSNITISGLLPLSIGLFVGVMVSLMGIGGGFFLIPAMVYILGMPTAVVIGTSLYQIVFITANVTLLHALSTQTVDVILALLLLTGSVIGAQIGTRIGAKLPAEHLRGLLAAIVLAVAVKLAYGLFVPPVNPFSVTME